MIRIKTDKDTVEQVKEWHLRAIISRIKQKDEAFQRTVYDEVTALPGICESKKLSFENMLQENDWEWMERFILADVDKLRMWTEGCEELLGFKQFRDMYLQYFSNGTTHFVDVEKKYNAYSFLKAMNITVCPYCENEYMDILNAEGDKERRTSEVDHFFSKDRYAGLAMCFYNLIPSGRICNGLKRNEMIGANPYEESIEDDTRIYPDLPIGVNMEMISAEECRPVFYAKNGMVINNKVFGLEQRYERHSEEVYNLLRKAQQYSDDKIEEMVRFGFFENVDEGREILFGPFDEEKRRHMLRQKMKKDLIGM